jgi:hypothetical protein
VKIAEQRAIAFEKLEQAGHLLEIRGNIREVARELEMAELNINDVLDVAASGIEFAFGFWRFGTLIDKGGFACRRRRNSWGNSKKERHGYRERTTKERAPERY